MKRKLFQHQKDGVKWLVSHRSRSEAGSKPLKGAILADDPGLGKTSTALVAAKLHQQTEQAEAVVICPKSLTRNWQREADAVETKVHSIHSSSKIPSLDDLPSKFVLIGDEFHQFQDMESTRTKQMLALALAPQCQAVYALTGTPIKNGRPLNLYPLLRAVQHPLGQDGYAYQVTYCDAHHEADGV
jgi:hypothetical protein